MVKKIATICMGILIFTFLLSCGTLGGGGEKRPDWTYNPPVDDEYYIGIGISTADDQALARTEALTIAQSFLAGDILTEIQSTTDMRYFEDNQGNVAETYEEEIFATVEANLQGTEIVDEFWDPREGYWIYLRLNIALWQEIQEKEMAALEKRVRDLVEPLVNAPNKSIAEKLSVLWKGWELVNESPYSGLVDTVMFEKEGDLFDVIEGTIVSYINSLSVDVPFSNVALEYGRPLEATVEVTTYEDEKIGKIPIGFYINETDEIPAITFNTDSNGMFAGEFTLPGLELGKTAVFARINLTEFGIDQDRMLTQLIVPESSFLVDLQQIKVGLTVNTPDETLPGVAGGVRSLFSDRDLPFKISNTLENEYEIVFDLIIEDVPENDLSGGIRFTYLRGVFSLVKNGRSLYSFESEKYKGGGLDYGQAHEKALEKMFEKLNRIDELYEGFMSVLDLD